MGLFSIDKQRVTCYDLSYFMTIFEKKQKNYVFVLAGKTAYHMSIGFQSNPYIENPFKTLWQKGWMSEARKYKRKLPYKVRFA